MYVSKNEPVSVLDPQLLLQWLLMVTNNKKTHIREVKKPKEELEQCLENSEFSVLDGGS